MSRLFVGLMSGTSLDGVDGVLVRCDGGRDQQVLAHHHRSYEPALAAELLALNARGDDELHRAALAARAVAEAYAQATLALLETAGTPAVAVRAIGAHGQTVRHRPAAGYTVQLLDAAWLAERTGIDVAAEFRPRDIAAGGQGAPLVPAFHRWRFGRAGATTAVLNLGGIANLSLIGPDGATTGFDTGPANLLMDGWSQRWRGIAYDDGGRWAAAGRVDAALLAVLRAAPFFALPPPKSTGRDDFHLAWLDAALARCGTAPSPVDVQATLAELTASTVADALRAQAPAADRLVVCGGGAANTHLLGRLAACLPGVEVRRSDDFGLPATQVEACAFAWLAQALVDRQPGNLPAVTGARGPRVLGALHPGRPE